MLSLPTQVCLAGFHQNYTQRLISAVFVSTQIISKLLLHDGCIVTNESVEPVCEDSQTETHSNCGGEINKKKCGKLN